jgi:hypothetical protein
MRILKFKRFDYNDYKELVDFVNKNSIDKNDIQQIVANDYHIMLYYWEEEKETANVSNHAKPKHFYMFQNDELNYNFK